MTRNIKISKLYITVAGGRGSWTLSLRSRGDNAEDDNDDGHQSEGKSSHLEREKMDVKLQPSSKMHLSLRPNRKTAERERERERERDD